MKYYLMAIYCIKEKKNGLQMLWEGDSLKEKQEIKEGGSSREGKKEGKIQSGA